MKTALDLDASLLDASEKNFVSNVRQHGWNGMYVAEDEERPGFSYTTGFWYRFRVPELILFSIPRNVAHQIFWGIFKDLEDGKRFLNNVPIPDVLEGYDVILKPVSPTNYPAYLGWNRWFYERDQFQTQQMFFPDMSGYFPWDDEVDPELRALQPDLSSPDD